MNLNNKLTELLGFIPYPNIRASLLLISPLFVGCEYSSKIGPFNVEQPVMLGKVQNIGGSMISASKQKDNFDISVYHGHAGWGVIGASGAIEYDISSENNETEELKKVIPKTNDLIKVNKVYFKSTLVVVPITLLLYMDLRNTIGIEGDVYENDSVVTRNK